MKHFLLLSTLKRVVLLYIFVETVMLFSGFFDGKRTANKKKNSI